MIFKNQPFLILLALWLVNISLYAQVTLEECYERAGQQYPLVKQRDYIGKTKEYSLQNASRGYLPSLVINGQQSYQSDVTKVSIPGQDLPIPTLSKNQYKVYADVGLNLYDGGVIHQQKQLIDASAKVDEQSLEVELYKLKERVNQIFFGVLLLDGRLAQQNLLIHDLELGLKNANASINNGTALKSTGDVLKAEILNARQAIIEQQATRDGYVKMLSMLTGMSFEEATTFKTPENINANDEISRPEIKLYDLQSARLDVEQKNLNTRVTPRLTSFLQTGYGKPGLNMLNPTADTYYIAGFRLNWNITGFYTLKKERQLLDARRSMINLQRQTFLFDTNYTSTQQQAEVIKLQKMSAADDEIIALRSQVKKTSAAQLQEGVISASDYLHEVNAENQARQNKVIHEIQLLLAQYTFQTTAGI